MLAKNTKIIFVLILVAILASVGWYYFGRQEEKQPQPASVPRASSMPQIATSTFLAKADSLRVMMITSAQGPIDLIVTDPDGFTITPATIIPSELEFIREIPGILYYSEMEKGLDGNPVVHVYSHEARVGDYRIEVIFNSQKANNPPAPQKSVYWLDFSVGEKSLTLASSTPISKIPSQGYVVRVVRDGSISLLDLASETPLVQINSERGEKKYTNIDFGFEFTYPADWTLHQTSVVLRNKSSKFELIGTAPEEKVPNTINPSLLVSVVTPDFADSVVASFKSLRVSTSDIVIANVQGIKYEYQFGGVPYIAISVPFGENRLLLGVNKEHEVIFKQILASFKFLK